jgi:hypothetical protein
MYIGIARVFRRVVNHYLRLLDSCRVVALEPWNFHKYLFNAIEHHNPFHRIGAWLTDLSKRHSSVEEHRISHTGLESTVAPELSSKLASLNPAPIFPHQIQRPQPFVGHPTYPSTHHPGIYIKRPLSLPRL